MNREERLVVYDRDEGICGLCGTPVPFAGVHLDHIVQRAEGGPDDSSNLRPTHADCNRRRERRYRGHVTKEGEMVFPMSEVARQIGVESDQVAQLWQAGKLRGYRGGGYGRIYVSPTEVVRVLYES